MTAVAELVFRESVELFHKSALLETLFLLLAEGIYSRAGSRMLGVRLNERFVAEFLAPMHESFWHRRRRSMFAKQTPTE